jgi:hypothetical protein
MATKSDGKTSVRTEDGCNPVWLNDAMVSTARRWAPNRVSKRKASELEVGDLVETALGWSGIEAIARP